MSLDGQIHKTPGRCIAHEIVDRVASKWSLYVIFILGGGTRRFNELKREVGGISQRMLTVTLRGLERDGIVSRTIYPVMPPRVEYDLTEAGRILLGHVDGLVGWSETYFDYIDQARRSYDEREAAAAQPAAVR